MDHEIRLAAFEWLKTQTVIHGEALPRKILEYGFTFQGERIPLLGPQGIWKPRIMELPLSITSIPEGRYSDYVEDGLLKYRYMGDDPYHPVNVRLRKTMQGNTPTPLIYFFRVVPGKYAAKWPVYITNDDPSILTFTVEIDDIIYLHTDQNNYVEENIEEYARRKYITTKAIRRLHQVEFREKVIQAYRSQCALCRLRHTELLDAAHIIPDKEEGGDPVVSNGLSLCKIHHAAFDKYILGITPDYTIKVREDILEEIDGPMLKYGLQSLENNKIILPNRPIDRPDRDRLDQRYREFLDAS